MTARTTVDLSAWKGRTAIDSSGREIGEIAEVYVDEGTGQPEWLAISTGWCGTLITFAPTAGAHASGDVVKVAA